MRGMWATALCLGICGCGDDGGSSADSTGSTGSSTGANPSTAAATTSAPETGADTTAATTAEGTTAADDAETTALGTTAGSSDDATGADGTSTGVASDCDYETVDGVLVIEAESLPIVDQWVVATDEPGFYGDGYIDWTGSSSNNMPGNGLMSVTLYFAEAGRYRLQWRNRIGMGNNTTEHNDTWVSFPDVAGYFGRRDDGGDERRVYPRPLCEDNDAMAAIADMAGVTSAGCPQGTSSDGWFKVYSSGASDWSWSTFTSDNDGHEIVVEVDAPGDYTMMLSQRADRHLIDRIVLYDVELASADAQSADNAPTACR